MILAGDIGGTKAILALFEDVEKRKKIKEEKFVSKDFSSFEDMVKVFLPKDVSLQSACFGLPGPIVNNTCYVTNLPWVVDGKKIQNLLGISSVFLLNDLVANAWGLCLLREEELYTLNEGTQKIGNRALISAGTGLGQAGLYFDGKKYHPFPTEGGHVGFAPSDDEEVEMWRYFKQKFGHVSYERFLSGQGIKDLYHFYVDVKKEIETPSVKKVLDQGDQARIISSFGMQKQCPICEKVVERFVAIYGKEAGNLALKFLALGGVFLGGGIAPKMLEVFKHGTFMKSFVDKGRFKDLLSEIKVQVILNPETALLGAAYHATSRMS